MLILLDNLDSFTYNLVSMFQVWGEEIFVFRNQALSAEEIVSMNPEGIVLSPGPGRPAEAGIMPQLIRMALRRRIPLLGVCLGHQGIAEAFGAEIVPAKRVMHGKISRITHTDSPHARRTAKSWDSGIEAVWRKAFSFTRNRS